MARQAQTAEVNTFVKGLITEASPLTFPENASLDEDNFVLRRNGSRERRLGIDYEEGWSSLSTGVPSLPEEEVAFSSYSWENAGGTPEKTLLAVQTGNIVKIFDVDISPLSSAEVASLSFSSSSLSQVFSFANIDGALVVATGQKDVRVLEYDGSSISSSSVRLKVRDQFGVEDTFEGKDLTKGSGLSVRPSSLTEKHTYNLRNQTWAVPRENSGSSTSKVDTISKFRDRAGVYPSNSDNVVYALYPNANDEDNRTGDQFFERDLVNNPPGSFPAPKGYFIIDVLDRGASRLSEVNDLLSEYSVLSNPISSLPDDSTPGGATCVAEYSGRVWYAGFSGSVVDGDGASPSLASYVLFSKLVESPSDISKCYQVGDPTSKENPDLVDTDGGFIRVDGAYGVKSLVNIGPALLVIAENGVWRIEGGSGYGFSATENKVTKLTDRGCVSPGSVAVVDNTVLYWAQDAIYHVAPDQFGDYQAKNLTQTTIQSFYEDISVIDKVYCQGIYDSYDRKVRWVYRNRVQDTSLVRELVLDMTLGSFYTSTLQQVSGSLPRVVAPVIVTPFRLENQQSPVTYEGVDVVYNGEQVVQEVSVRGVGAREVAYITLTSLTPLEFTFSLYRDASFVDWRSLDGEGVDARAFLVTGYLSGGDFIRYKQVPYIQFHFTRTEDGFEEDGTGNWVPTNQSSCKVQAQWEWANSANSNRWGRSFQAYRYRRLYSPSGLSDPFDNGFEVITTKNKLRGKGKVLSLLIETEPEKDLRLLGWSMILGVASNV